MAEARRMGKSELFAHFADRFELKRAQAREFFDELAMLSEKELKRSGEFVLPGMVKLVVQKRKARMGRNPATGEAIKIPAKTVVKARVVKQIFQEISRVADPVMRGDYIKQTADLLAVDEQILRAMSIAAASRMSPSTACPGTTGSSSRASPC